MRQKECLAERSLSIYSGNSLAEIDCCFLNYCLTPIHFKKNHLVLSLYPLVPQSLLIGKSVHLLAVSCFFASVFYFVFLRFQRGFNLLSPCPLCWSPFLFLDCHKTTEECLALPRKENVDENVRRSLPLSSFFSAVLLCCLLTSLTFRYFAVSPQQTPGYWFYMLPPNIASSQSEHLTQNITLRFVVL